MDTGPDFFPPRDRRSSKRWITTRNVLVAGSTIFVLLLVASVIEKARHSSSDHLGRLSTLHDSSQPVQLQAPATDSPTPIVEGDAVDPLSIDAARKQQYLGVTPAPPMSADTAGATAPPASESSPATRTSTSTAAPLLDQLKPGQKISITGGADGVKVDVTSTEEKTPAPPDPQR